MAPSSLRPRVHRGGRFCHLRLVLLVILLSVPTAWASPATQASPPAAPPLDDFSPAFLGMFRKVLDIEPAIRRHATAYAVDLALAEAVCMYESGGNAGLSSAAGAQGYFQVMPATARTLRVGSNIEAGISYLAQLIARFGREDYALAAYNGGPTRVGRGGPMPLESLQYVMGVGGYRSVLREYGPAVRAYASGLGVTTVRPGETWATLSARLGLPVVQVRLHNPFLAPRPLRAGARVAYPPTPRADLLLETDQGVFYRARLGDHYIKLAYTLGVDIEAFRTANVLWRLEAVLPGRLLTVPSVSPAPSARAVPVAAVAAPPRPAAITHQVRAGDTLASLSRRYGTTVRAIQAANAMGSRTRIVRGQRLRIPTS